MDSMTFGIMIVFGGFFGGFIFLCSVFSFALAFWVYFAVLSFIFFYDLISRFYS